MNLDWLLAKNATYLMDDEDQKTALWYLHGHVYLLNNETEQVLAITPERHCHFERRRVVPQYIHSSYDYTWSRVLYVGKQGILELDLTPINPTQKGVWDQIKLEKMRLHGTSRREKDILTDVLPDPVIDTLIHYFGPELTNRLMTYDYLSEIEVDDVFHAGRHSNGGGVPLQFIKDLKVGTASFWRN